MVTTPSGVSDSPPAAVTTPGLKYAALNHNHFHLVESELRSRDHQYGLRFELSQDDREGQISPPVRPVELWAMSLASRTSIP